MTMLKPREFSIATLRLRNERHVVHARQQARDIAAQLGFDHQEQIRLATATSELARNAYRYATDGVVEFLITPTPPHKFLISVTDSGPGIANLTEILDGKYVSQTGLGKGIIGTRRLMDHFEITTSSTGTRVETGKELPGTSGPINADVVRRLKSELARTSPADPLDEVERQNQELLKTLAELREKQDQLTALNRELEDTNRGVVALYAELDRNADDLRRVSDLKTTFLSNISHEFRTPLNSISSLCQMLMNRMDGDLTPDQEKQVMFIQKSAAELSELVNDLLDLAKVEAGRIDVKPRHFEVQDLFATLRGMLKPLLTGNSLDLIFESDPELPTLYTDEGKVSQILRNLISNALKFTRQGYVRLRARLENEAFVVFEVEDTGIGIAPEHLENIFEEFVQIESEMQINVKGTGLGLPLSRSLAELLGGTINVRSEVGVGSTFTVKIPIQFAQLDPVPIAASESKNSKGPMVLFIEDNLETRFVFDAALKSSNFNLQFSLSLPETRKLMHSLSPDVVVLDRYIEGQDCLPYIQEMKSAGYKGPILVISVVNDPKAAYKAGADAFLPKPVAPLTLVSTLRELTDGHSSRTVLLVDDDEVTRYLLADALTRMGYRIVEAQNGREAIRMTENRILHGVFLDVVMPDLSGLEVLREIRRNRAMNDVPVIVHSSKDLSPEEIKLVTSLGAVIFPKRVFSNQESSESLRDVLGTSGIGQ
jgi:signal transduction histidine kinase/DNA-binding response OmpR family regulator